MVSVSKKKKPPDISPGNWYALLLRRKKIHLGNMCAWTRELRFSGEYGVHTHTGEKWMEKERKKL